MRTPKRELISPAIARMRLAVDEREWLRLEPSLTLYHLPNGTALVDYAELTRLARPVARPSA